METPLVLLSLVKLSLIFGILIVLLKLHVRLWLTIFIGSFAAMLLTDLPFAKWPEVMYGALANRGFVLLCSMIFLIQMLSGVQEATGQSKRLVRGLERWLHRPRLRLIFFPALVGLLPMPGGALFSCPMIRDAADGMGLSDEKKSVINYWFRHIWETAWPLYPGYALASSLLHIPLSTLWRYTFPLVICSFCVGWFFFMRELAGSSVMREHEKELCKESGGEKEPLGAVLANALPLAVTLVGAGLVSLLFDCFWPFIPGQVAFCISLTLAVAVALWQGRGHRQKPLLNVAFNQNSGRMFLLLVVIYIFKDTIIAGGLVEAIGQAGKSGVLVCALAVFLPLVSGLLTGLMVGFVGLCFPILLAVISHSTVQEHSLALVVAALAAGNAGQLLSPLHVCLVVTCEFFRTHLQHIWKALFVPVLCLLGCSLVWAFCLYLLGARM